jgi:hypothetical protein
MSMNIDTNMADRSIVTCTGMITAIRMLMNTAMTIRIQLVTQGNMNIVMRTRN